MKIGIITHYYRSLNYGGNLQAYALCKYLIKHGYDAEQICYDRSFDTKLNNLRRVSIVKKALSFVKRKYIAVLSNKISSKLDIREKAILRFNDKHIPHSKKNFNENTIALTNKDYHVFISGSDQVWHPSAVCNAYLLNFVEKNRLKLSYAASVATNDIGERILPHYENALRNYDAISVREELSVNLIEQISLKSVEWVVDPTLLLSRSDWDEICSKRRIEEKYVFCYFLGDDKNIRSIAFEYAKSRGFKLATFPYLGGYYRSCDKKFGDIQLFDVSPNDFISLIKYSECIFTDSFHAMLFSGIYEKEYFVFERNSNKGMSLRIESLVDLYDSESHFCNSPERVNIKYIESIDQLVYNKHLPKLEELRKKSEDFLLRNIIQKEEFNED